MGEIVVVVGFFFTFSQSRSISFDISLVLSIFTSVLCWSLGKLRYWTMNEEGSRKSYHKLKHLMALDDQCETCIRALAWAMTMAVRYTNVQTCEVIRRIIRFDTQMTSCCVLVCVCARATFHHFPHAIAHLNGNISVEVTVFTERHGKVN